MTKRAFQKIKEGLKEAIAVARGETAPARFLAPDVIDVAAVRRETGLSQVEFPAAFGFTIHQIRDWEQGRVHPAGALRAYLMLIAAEPENVRDLLARARVKSRRAA